MQGGQTGCILIKQVQLVVQKQIVTLPIFDITPSDPTLMLKTRRDSRTYPVAAKVMCLQVQLITKALDTWCSEQYKPKTCS